MEPTRKTAVSPKKSGRFTLIINIVALAVVVVVFFLVLFFESGKLKRTPVVQAVTENFYSDTLHVITDRDYSPYSFYDAEGNYSGYDVELITLIANRIQMNLDLQFTSWNEGIALITSGGADVLMTCDFLDSFEGFENVTKSEPSSEDDFIAYSRVRGSFVSNLYGKSIAVMENGNAVPQLRNLGLTRYCVKYADNRAAMRALIDGEVDYAVMRQAVGAKLLKELDAPSSVKGRFSVGSSYMCFAVSNGNPGLVEKIDLAIEAIKISGDYDRLREKWLTTFMRPYTLLETLANNSWLVYLFLVVVLYTIFAFFRYRAREARMNEEHKRELSERERLVMNLTKTYDVAFKVNLDDDAISILGMDASLVSRCQNFRSFSQVVDSLLTEIVFEPDRALMTQELNCDHILEKLSSGQAYSVDHRIIKDGELIWGKMTVFDLGRNQIAVCFKTNTHEILQNHLQQSSFEDYYALFAIDLDAEVITVLKDTSYYRTGKIGESAPFREMMEAFARSLNGEAKEFFLRRSDINMVRQEFAVENKHVFSYQSNIIEGNRWVTVTSFVLTRHKDGCPAVITLGFSLMDSIGSDKQELMTTVAQQKDMLEIQQAQLQEALSMAQSASRAKTTFLNNMSHDIRTPMNAIIGYTGLATRHIGNEDQVRDYLGKIAQSSEHLLSLINDVLDMSRIESGKMHLEEKDENLSEIIHTLKDMVMANAVAKHLDFKVVVQDVKEENIICDRLRLNQVLLNIVSNAIKYTPSGGSVLVTVSETGVRKKDYAEYRFTVKDTGIGMDKEFLKTFFEPFSRARSATVSGIQGTGLGMAITKTIVDMMGGRIAVDSEPGVGTEVSVSLDFRIVPVDMSAFILPKLSKARTLVVDDDPQVCMSLARMLKDIGIRSLWCTSGKEAVLRAEDASRNEDEYKVFFVDRDMPDISGLETSKRIRDIVGPNVPVILLSEDDWSDVEVEAREAGVTGFIGKPMFPSDLHRVLEKCLGEKVRQSQSKSDSFSLEGRKILIVEDNELNCEIASAILEEYGCTIFTANDGDVAVEKIRTASPGDYDLVLMDIQMPTMNGHEATRRIRALGTEISRIPIIAMTANAFEEDRRAAFEAGMNEHIAKPVDIERMKAVLSEFL